MRTREGTAHVINNINIYIYTCIYCSGHDIEIRVVVYTTNHLRGKHLNHAFGAVILRGLIMNCTNVQ
jgi:hypothetical protein